MTRQEAAEVLRELNDNYFADVFDDVNEALQIAIQELETINVLERKHMNPKEAIKELSYDNTAYGGMCTKEVRIAAIKALEKRVPMEVKNKQALKDFSGHSYTIRGDCPSCGCKDLLASNMDYCMCCGQLLSWEN